MSHTERTKVTEKMIKTPKILPIQRQPYSPPELRKFGSVGTLTQSGSGVEQEPMTGMGMMNPEQRP